MTTFQLKNHFEGLKEWAEREYQKELDKIAGVDEETSTDELLLKLQRDEDNAYDEIAQDPQD